MLAALVAMYLMFYLTEVLDISARAVVAVTAIMVVMRIFDAVNDPVMGIIVDNTRSRWGPCEIVLGPPTRDATMAPYEAVVARLKPR